MSSFPVADITVGQIYQRLAENQAPLDRSRRFRKIHDWILFVGVADTGNNSNSNSNSNGAVDTIQRVEFDLGPSFEPNVFVHHSPVRSSSGHWRFATRQQTFAVGFTAKIRIIGVGGTVKQVAYTLRAQTLEQPLRFQFQETNPTKPLSLVPFPKDAPTFGIELELTTAQHASPQKVADQVAAHAGLPVDVYSTGEYAQAMQNYQHWKLMGDSSIQCHVDRPDCHAFEIVSPILKGDLGLAQCQSFVRALKQVRTIRVNKSMGFHVHVSVKGKSVSDLVKICQNFVKYEAAMDAMMPFSRRGNQNSFCRSNYDAVPGRSNKQKNLALTECQTIEQLADLMNPGRSRYYKLNLQNLD